MKVLGLALAVLIATVMSGCGSTDVDEERGRALDPAVPDRKELAAYKRRCGRLVADTGEARARIIYPAQTKMDVGDASTVTAKVTFNRNTPADELLPAVDAGEKRGVVVSCLLEARLRAAAAEFTVEPPTWERQSLYSGPAEWSWDVTPKRAGDQTMSLQVRPFVQVDDRSSGTVSDVVRSSHIEASTIRVDVHDPGWLQALMRDATGFLKDTYALLVALAAVVTLVYGWMKGWFRKRETAVGPP